MSDCPDMSLEQIARALGGEVSGGQVLAPGPNHSAEDRSLAVKHGEKGLVVYSHAGDDIWQCKDHVRAKLGLPPWNGKRSSYPLEGGYGPRPSPERKIVARYDYTDEDGNLLFQVERYTPKKFVQRRPDSNGGWTWKLGDTRRVLYRLPELIEAVANEHPIFICEGEKAVDALSKLGVPATCSPHGAGKWRDVYSAHLKGAKVIILPDADAPGRHHAEQVARSLRGVASSVKVLALPGLPEGGDVYDWISTGGGTAEKLWALVETPVGRKPEAEPKTKSDDWRSHVFTAASLRTMEFPEVSYVVPGIIPEGLTILAGKPKVGKSWMALDVALGIATGQDVLGGTHVAEGDVLYCCLEDNQRRLQRRVTKLLSPLGQEWPERLTLATRWRRLDQGGVEDINAWCNSVPTPRLILLDTLAGVRPARQGTDTLYESDYKALCEMHRLANEREGIAAVALHHTRKMDADDPVDTISGSLGLPGVADTCLILARGPTGTTLYVRGRDIEEAERAIIFGSANCRWTLLGDAGEVHRSDTRTAILNVLAAATEPMSPDKIAVATSINRNAVDQRLYHMASAGEVAVISRGQYAHPDNADKFVRAHKNRKK